MTRTIFLVTGIVLSALVVGVPSAFGSLPPVDDVASPQDALASVYANERATLASPSRGTVSRPDSHDIVSQSSGIVSRPDSHDTIGSTGVGYLDAHERAALANERADGFVAGDDFVRIDPADLPTVSVQTTSSGRDVEWPQIGIGFGVGMLLALGLLLAMRTARVRPLAH